ncbi:MAG: helix-turn-helix domain-containing protein [Myxococcota bacterium]
MSGMRGIDELDHYELLEVGRGASGMDIDRAYRLAQQTYADGSLAMYGVFEARDASAIRERLDEAYRVLADPELRTLYDQDLPEPAPRPGGTGLTGQGASASPEFGGEGGIGHSGQPAYANQVPASAILGDPSEERIIDSFDSAVEEFDTLEDEGGGDFDGVRLRRTRLFRGYEIDDISDVTKVSCAHLRNIEDENFGALPADVYVRGFVTAYAKTIGLDPTLVVPSYMERMKGARESGSRGLFARR